ncbi:MAG TPA: hypothetical protein VGI39_28140, partial [Polyangiaceae bacterium]
MRSSETNGATTNVGDGGGGASTAADVRIESLGQEIGVECADEKPRGWFTRLARWYLARRVERRK